MDVAKEKLVGAYEATSKFTSKTFNKVAASLCRLARSCRIRSSEQVCHSSEEISKSKVVGREIK